MMHRYALSVSGVVLGAILDERISFGNFEHLPNRTFRESVRRSQGLSIALLRNLADLAIISHRKKARLAIANAPIPVSNIPLVGNAILCKCDFCILDGP